MAGASGNGSSACPFFTLGFLVLALGIVQKWFNIKCRSRKKISNGSARS
jgi:hypothetical protein